MERQAGEDAGVGWRLQRARRAGGGGAEAPSGAGGSRDPGGCGDCSAHVALGDAELERGGPGVRWYRRGPPRALRAAPGGEGGTDARHGLAARVTLTAPGLWQAASARGPAEHAWRPRECLEGPGRGEEGRRRDGYLQSAGDGCDGPGQPGWAAGQLRGQGPAPGAAAGPYRLQVSEGSRSRSGGARGLERLEPGETEVLGARVVSRAGAGWGPGQGASRGAGGGRPPSGPHLRHAPPFWATRTAPEEAGGAGERGLVCSAPKGPGRRVRSLARVAAQAGSPRIGRG